MAHWCVPKGQLLTSELQKTFLRSFEAGLQMRWNLEWRFLEKKVDYHKTTYVVSSLNLQNMKVALSVLCLGLSFATLAFVAEILSHTFWKR